MTTNDERPDRDEDIIDRMLAGEPAASDIEAAARVPYEQVVKRLREFDDATLPAGWEERAALQLRGARAREARAARRPWVLGGAVVLAMAAAVLLFAWTRDDQRRPDGQRRAESEVAIVIHAAKDGAKRGTAALDDALEARPIHRDAHVELRLYQDEALVARCPGAPTCDGPDGLTLHHIFRAPGRYLIVLFRSKAPLPAPVEGGLEADVITARERGAIVHQEEAIVVTR